MGSIKIAFWGGLAVLAGLWLIADPLALRPAGCADRWFSSAVFWPWGA